MRRGVFKGLLGAGMLAAGVLTSTPVFAAVDMFIKVGNIIGESTDKIHKGESDVLSWSWGTSKGTARTKKGLQPPACIQDLTFTKYVDRASPDLILNGVSGAVVPTAVLTMRKAGIPALEFLRLEMSNVFVSSYQTGGSGGEDRLTETITLHFDTLDGVYRLQNPDGTPGTEVPFEVSGGSCPQ
jgi:type VI secretion system secreted protein Hcp